MGKLINFRHVNEHGDFAAILAHYQLAYTVKGAQIRLCCPFHDDTTPSLSIATEENGTALANSYNCFGCDASGSIIDFVAAIDGHGDLRAAAEFVADVSGCALAPPRSAKAKPAKAQKRPGAAHRGPPPGNGSHGAGKHEEGACGAPEGVSGDLAPLKFTLKLASEHPYLAERLDPETQTEFGVGYLGADRRSMMADRVCIPIHDAAGELVAYVGRYPSGDVPEGANKYMFPARFPKSSVLFNAHRVGDTEDLVVVEGFFSAMRLHMLGAPVVALMGTAGSEAHVAILQAMGVRRILVLLDGDEAGQKALPALLSLLTRSFFVTVGQLPDACGPDDLSDDALHAFAAVF